MNTRAQIRLLPDGRRLHMHDGPIDLIVEAWGEHSQIQIAYRAAAARFVSVLDELCAELKFLRQPSRADDRLPQGSIARRMVAAVASYAAATFITPMAAVAGAVAEEVLATMTGSADLARAYVNDGGDIALHLKPGEKFVIGMMQHPEPPPNGSLPRGTLNSPVALRVPRGSSSFLTSDEPPPFKSKPATAAPFGTTTIEFADPVRGIATSGWRGRSFSLGIADAVTVLADSAAMADAAATIVANAVDLPGHPAIVRVPASELAPDSDLGDRLVTQSVGKLSLDEIDAALSAGARSAERLRSQGLIRATALNLQSKTHVVGAHNAMPNQHLVEIGRIGEGTASAVPVEPINQVGFSH